MRARGSGVGPLGSRERTVAGKEAHWILQSDRSMWKAFLASVECRAAGSLPGVAVGERPNGPHQRPIPTFRHFREKLMTASGPWTSLLSSSSTASTPPDCPERLQWAEEEQAALAALPALWMKVLGSPSAVYVVTSRFPEKEINIQIHLSPKWSFAAKEKCCPNSRIWR